MSPVPGLAGGGWRGGDRFTCATLGREKRLQLRWNFHDHCGQVWRPQVSRECVTVSQKPSISRFFFYTRTAHRDHSACVRTAGAQGPQNGDC
jgi:hypothetical protein